MHMSRNRVVLGNYGEAQAAAFLQSKRIRVVDRHFHTRWGELDLVCRDGETWVFVEVKARSRFWIPSALEAITLKKQRKLLITALIYMKKHRLEDQPLRFDIITIEAICLQWIPNAFY